MISLQSGSATDIGLVRASNQDVALETDNLFAVADGMGGHAGGEVAARVAIDTLRTVFNGQGTSSALLEAVHQANRAVWERSQQNAELRGMGTTLAVVALVSGDGNDILAFTGIGDSRAYMFRKGKLVQITTDHSVVAEMVRHGEITAEEALVHPRRHMLTRALGMDATIEADVVRLRAIPGDRVLLCSDGLTNELEEVEISAVLRYVSNPKRAAEELVRRAKAHGGSDNITTVVVDVVGDSYHRTPSAATTSVATGRRPRSSQGTTWSITDKLEEEDVEEVPSEYQDRDDISASSSRDSLSSSRDLLDTTEALDDGILQLERGVRNRRLFSAVVIPANRPSKSSRLRPSRKPKLSLAPPRSHRRHVTFRSVIFVLAVLVVIGGVFGTIDWYAKQSYFVGLSTSGAQHTQYLAIYKGRPGGVLWFKPQVVTRTSVSSNEVLPARLPGLRDGVVEPSLAAARQYVHNLVVEFRSVMSLQSPSSPARSLVLPTRTSAVLVPYLSAVSYPHPATNISTSATSRFHPYLFAAPYSHSLPLFEQVKDI